jgi:two-component system, NtrC family, sensor histidine kinase HydH
VTESAGQVRDSDFTVRASHLEVGDPKGGGALRTRLAWVIGLRVTFLTILFSVTAALYLRKLDAESESARVLLATFGGGFLLSAIYGLLLRRGRTLRRLAVVQLLVDPFLWAAFAYVSGGPTSVAVSFFALSGLVGSVLDGRKGAWIAAAAGLAVYGGLSSALVLGYLQPPNDVPSAGYVIAGRDLVFALTINCIGIVVVAWLAGYLAQRLQSTGGRLQLAEQRAAQPRCSGARA